MALNKTKVADIFKRQRSTSRRALSAQYDNTLACRSFYNGDAMTYTDYIQFYNAGGQRQRALVQFNDIQSSVDAIVGFMAQNRRQAKFFARLPDAQQQELYSKKMNAVYSYHRENENADQIESDQDLSMLVVGYGATETELSYIVGNATRNPNGEINKVKLDDMCVYWDPAARAKNLSDARWMGYFQDYDLMEALSLFQDSEPEDFQSVDADSASGFSGYIFNPFGGLYDKIKMDDAVDWSNKDEDRVRVYNHQWFEYETFYRAKNPLYQAATLEEAAFYKAQLDIIASKQKDLYPDDMDVADMFSFDPLAEELVFDARTKRMLVEDFGELIQPVSFTRKCFYTAIMSGDHVFKWFKSICQEGFSIKFKTGTFNETAKRWEGMVNPMMEPQRYRNKAITEMLFTIAANSKGGVIVEEDAVEDIADFESKWAKTDAVIVARPGAIANGKFMEKTKAALPTGLEYVVQLSENAIRANGVDPSFMGDAGAQESGVLYRRRIKQAISRFAKYFDSITLYQKEDARLHADLIPVWAQNNVGSIIRMTGEEGAPEFIQITEDAFAPEYDFTIQEAPQTDEDKLEQAQVITQMADKYLSVGALQQASALNVLAIRNMPLDGEERAKVIAALQPSENVVPLAQYQQLLQQFQQLQSQITQVQVQETQSKTALNMAKVKEVQANIHEKGASTVKQLEDAERLAEETRIMKQSGGQAQVTV